MSNNSFFSINRQAPKNQFAMGQMRGRNGGIAGLPQNELITAIINRKDESGIGLTLQNGQNLNVVRGSIAGEIGDEVFFEIKVGDGQVALKQVFPGMSNESFAQTKLNIQSNRDLLMKDEYSREYYKDYNEEDAQGDRADIKREASRVVNRINRIISNIGRVTDVNVLNQLAASGIDLKKISIELLKNVTKQVDSAKKSTGLHVLGELKEKFAAIQGLSDAQITGVLTSGQGLTLDNLAKASQSAGVTPQNNLSESDWQSVRTPVEDFLNKNELPINEENLQRARFLLEIEAGLNLDNFEKLIFLQDIEGNVNLDTLLEKAVDVYEAGEDIAQIEVFDREAIYNKELEVLSKQIAAAEIRLSMSYEANLQLLGTQLQIDLDPQIFGLQELKEYEKTLLSNALKQADIEDSPHNRNIIYKTYENIKAQSYLNYSIFKDIAENTIGFNLNELGSAAIEKYNANATVASLKYGDSFNKVAEQFAPLLKSLGFDDNEFNIRAAKILSMNDMDITEQNLSSIKSIDAKILDVVNRLHPMIAANMIKDGHNPSAMHMDEILSYIDQFKNLYGTNENELLYENIMEMDKNTDIEPQVRQKVIEIYQMLHKITKNNGAGIGFAVNADIELTLQNLLDFSKNFQSTRQQYYSMDGEGREYTADGLPESVAEAKEADILYAKSLVSRFIENAKPASLAELVTNESMDDKLEASVAKLQEIAARLKQAGTQNLNLDIQRIGQEIEELANTSKGQIRYILNRGLPLTLGTIRSLRRLNENNGSLGLHELEDMELSQLADMLQTTDLADFIQGKTPAQSNSELAEKIEEFRDNADSIEKISSTDILLKSIDFRSQMIANSQDHSFSMMLNRRPTDVNMYVLNENMDISKGAHIFFSLNTRMGHIEGMLDLGGKKATLNMAAEGAASLTLAANKEYLSELMSEIGISEIDFRVIDESSMKNKLSNLGHFPI